MIHNFLSDESLKVFFNPEENLLANVRPTSYNSLKDYLARVIRNDAYIEVLECIP